MADTPAPDVLILGAGIAGLVAAREIARAGKRVVILEARQRIGGRIHTIRDPTFPIPIELGAEFIHGQQDDTFALLREFGVEAYELPNDHWQRGRDGRWFPTDLARDLDPIMRPAAELDDDVRFASYLARFTDEPKLADAAAMAQAYVAGYDAADPARIGAKAVGEEWTAGNVGEEPQFRLKQGYGAVIEGLARQLAAMDVPIHLNTRATRITWRRGRVEVAAKRDGTTITFTALRGVVTLPVGVLQLPAGDMGGVRFEPEIAEHRAAYARLGSGPVCKLVLRFREAFWEREDVGRRMAGRPLKDAMFFHAPQSAAPTWWTMAPVRVPVLTGWAGGPQTDRLAGRSEREMIGIGLDALAELFTLPRDELNGLFERGHTSDWRSDPFARGAYSYEMAGAGDARERIARPIEGTLFFAGEATDTTGGASTVAGAIASARRAAKEALG